MTTETATPELALLNRLHVAGGWVPLPELVYQLRRDGFELSEDDVADLCFALEDRGRLSSRLSFRLAVRTDGGERLANA